MFFLLENFLYMSLLEKIDKCFNNPEKQPTLKLSKHTAYRYLLFTHCSFDSNRNKRDQYRLKTV